MTARTNQIEVELSERYGYEDGNTGEPMRCPADATHAQKVAYRQGYEQGRKDLNQGIQNV